MIGIGVIGCGYWGPNLVRNFAASREAEVVKVCDLDAGRLRSIADHYPTIETTGDAADLIGDPRIKAVVIATPVRSHYALALQALQAGKHVLVEKPITETAQEARHLIEEASNRDLVLMVDHTFVFTGAVRKIKDLITAGELGEVYYYDSSRINLGLFQHDVNVLWDLAVHDLSILSYLMPERPQAVSATGSAHIPGRPENTAFLTLFFNSGLLAHINVNWLAPAKMRRTLIGGSRKMVTYDDLEPSEKVKVYDKGVTVAEDPKLIREMLIGYRIGDMHAPRVDATEALKLEVEHFVGCIRDGAVPVTDGHEGLRIVEVLEAADRSLRDRGVPIEL